MEKNETRQQIIQVGTELIARQGFNATGIDAVLKQAGVPKGSFYYYFGSKEEFGLAVIDQFALRYARRLDDYLGDETLSPLNRIRRYLESVLARLEQNHCTKGCLIGNLGQEMADQHERFRTRLEEVFRSWRERFARCLREARAAGELAAAFDVDVMAEFILSGLEGAILRTKVMKSPRPLQDFIDILFARVLV
ncbi:TetR family transcriptional regulator [Geotalea uraniireducens]|uniref:TetR family transcriptional regulator n=1 Tax=Geotalea uraniireducens TaxID=351604 RepID=A0ABN6VRP7_9BACT|nr:TetR family transcriptional regulator C-terminal domain-containing protein [Geotalea uraniireducens]BDV41841.1 TetR family transcriptional regulator [Geotalea uraniireducens]